MKSPSSIGLLLAGATFGLMAIAGIAVDGGKSHLDPGTVCPGHPWGFVGATGAFLLIGVGALTVLAIVFIRAKR